MLIEAMVEVADRLLTLLKASKEHKGRLFVNHVDPLFTNMTSIHRDYCASFDLIGNLIEKPIITEEELLRVVLERRQSLEHLRIVTLSLVKALGNSSYASRNGVSRKRNKVKWLARAYVVQCAEYIESVSNGTEGVSGPTRYTTLISYFSDVAGGSIAAEERAEFLKHLACDLKERWGSICELYAELRVQCL